MIPVKVGKYFVFFLIGLVIAAHTALFFAATAVLWGFPAMGLTSCLVMMMFAFDKGGYARKILGKERHHLSRSDWWMFGYFIVLLVVAVSINTVYLVSYLLNKI